MRFSGEAAGEAPEPKRTQGDHIAAQRLTAGLPYSGKVNQAPTTANATYCATLCDQLVADGLTAAFVAPGSRSTPLALALVDHAGIRVEMFHNEAAAAFAALGHGLATGSPALVLCSSGTAGAHFYAAVIEADAAAVPLIIVTADRPPELWGIGAPQTIDQTNLYGTRVRAFVEPGPPDDLDPSQWRPIARQLWTSATASPPGPVHANLSFRDPLTGTAGDLPPSLVPLSSVSAQAVDGDLVDQVADLLASRRGVIVAGRNVTAPSQVLRLAELLGWPILADHRSGCRTSGKRHAIRHFDSVLRDTDFATTQRPDVVLRLGEIVSSKATSQWLTACAAAGTDMIASRPHGRNIDPEAVVQLQFDEADFVPILNEHLHGVPADPAWLEGWTAADEVASQAISTLLSSSGELSEIAVAQAAVTAVPAGGALVVSSSMPVRDVEWFGPNRSDIDVFANRGANGIDGIISTAIGVALAGQPTVCLIGDVAFLHDSASLVALRERAIDLTIVVTDNDGGAIFSFLPQHELLDTKQYETLFGTPHGTDLAALVTAHGLDVAEFEATALVPDGIRIVIAKTNRETNRRLHDAAHQAVATALSQHG